MCLLRGITRYVDIITIQCNVPRGKYDTMILIRCRFRVIVFIFIRENDPTWIQTPKIRKICVMYQICKIFVVHEQKTKICTVCTYFSPREVKVLISTSSFGGYSLQYRLYHWTNTNVIRMSSLEGSNNGFNGCALLYSSPTSARNPFRTWRNGRRRRMCSMSTAWTLGGNFISLRRHWNIPARYDVTGTRQSCLPKLWKICQNIENIHIQHIIHIHTHLTVWGFSPSQALAHPFLQPGGCQSFRSMTMIRWRLAPRSLESIPSLSSMTDSPLFRLFRFPTFENP